LRIELLESATGTFFDSGSSQPNGSGKELLVMLAEELQKLPNTISIEGHTDSKPFAGSGSYGNWELSSDRANAARRLMQDSGVRHDQVSQIRGFADQNLRKKDDPEDPSNRRITILVQYLPKPEPENEPTKTETEHASESAHPQ
jgi:chemotaxis protein MotB